MGFLYFLAFIAALLPLAFFAEPMYASMFPYFSVPALGINTSIINVVIFPGALVLILLIAFIANCVRTTRKNKLVKDRSMFKPLAMYAAIMIFVYGVRVLSQHLTVIGEQLPDGYVDILQVIFYVPEGIMHQNFIIGALCVIGGALLFLLRHPIAKNASRRGGFYRVFFGALLIAAAGVPAYISLTTYSFSAGVNILDFFYICTFNDQGVMTSFVLLFYNILVIAAVIGVTLTIEIPVSIVWQVSSRRHLNNMPESEFDPNMLPMKKQKVADKLRNKLNAKLDKSDAKIDREIESILSKANARAAA